MPVTIARKNKDTGEVTYIEYNTVAERLQEFWKDHPDWRIETSVTSAAKLVCVQATIKDQNGNIVSTGTAEEDRDFGYINKTSAVENAETSAVGRALAFLGYAGSEIASAEEIVVADEQQIKKTMWASAHKTMKATLENIESILAIKQYVADGDALKVVEALNELRAEDKAALWKAWTKGGPFTTAEQAYFKSDEYSAARKVFFGLPEDHEAEENSDG